MKNIEFYISNEEIYNSIPHPKPASKFIPSWYKKLDANLGDPNTVGSIKKCMPFLDSLTSGYIIPLWHDIHFKTYIDENYGPRIEFNWPISLHSKKAVDHHNVDQIEGSDISQTTFGQSPLKFVNPWIIKTPPGYSCLFVQPLNHYNDNFELISAIVDTDTFTSNIHFPFVWHKNNFNDIVERGTPLVQVIPFKREEWASNVKIENSKNSIEFNSTVTKLKTMFQHRYKTFFWHRKKFR